MYDVQLSMDNVGTPLFPQIVYHLSRMAWYLVMQLRGDNEMSGRFFGYVIQTILYLFSDNILFV